MVLAHSYCQRNTKNADAGAPKTPSDQWFQPERNLQKNVEKNSRIFQKNVKMQKDIGYGEMRCWRRRFKMTSQKRHLSGVRQFSVVAFFC